MATYGQMKSILYLGWLEIDWEVVSAISGYTGWTEHKGCCDDGDDGNDDDGEELVREDNDGCCAHCM